MVSSDTFSALTTTIHEAALDPERWAEALSALVAALGASAGGLIVGPSAGRPDFAVSIGVDPDSILAYRAYYGGLDPIVPAVQQMDTGTVMTHNMVLPRDILVRTEFYNDWARRQCIDDCMVAKFSTSDDMGVISLATPAGGGDFPPEALGLMRALIPHLRIAIRTRALLQGYRIERNGALDALGRAGQGVLFVNAKGRVAHANGAAADLLRQADGLSVGGSGLEAATPSLTSSLRRLVARAAGALGDARGGGSLRLDRPSGRAPLLVTVSSLGRGSAADMPWADEQRAIVLIGSPAPTRATPVGELRDLFGLTPAEAAVAVAVAKGRGVVGAASDLGMAVSTARTHLHRAFEKTGTKRQADLAHTIMRIVPSVGQDLG